MNSHRDKMLAALDDHQAKIVAIVRRGDALLAVDARPDPALLSQKRWELTRLLSAYQAFKHHQLFDPVVRTGPPARARVASQMKAECIALGEEYRAHVARCTNLDIVAHWESYRPAVARLLARLEAHMSRERWVVSSILLPMRLESRQSAG